MTRPLRWTIAVPSLARPAGGVIALVEVANALSRAGQLVRVLHVPTPEAHRSPVASPDWARLALGVDQLVLEDLDEPRLPDADVLVYTAMLVAVARAGRRPSAAPLLEALRDERASSGLRVLYYQGQGVFDPVDEELAIRLPGPKVCVGAALAAHLVACGVPQDDVIPIPNGVDHSTFRIRRGVPGRAPRVAMHYDPHPVKGGDAGLEAIERLHRDTGLPATVFGARLPARRLASGIDTLASPPRSLLVDVYNSSSVFLQPSRREGFGMCAVESMACGCTLVTTDNGGSAEYAFDGDTALVCGGEPDAMVAAIGRLLADDELRARLAGNGARFVQRFDWSSSARRLIALAHDRTGAAVGPEGAS